MTLGREPAIHRENNPVAQGLVWFESKVPYAIQEFKTSPAFLNPSTIRGELALQGRAFTLERNAVEKLKSIQMATDVVDRVSRRSDVPQPEIRDTAIRIIDLLMPSIKDSNFDKPEEVERYQPYYQLREKLTKKVAIALGYQETSASN